MTLVLTAADAQFIHIPKTGGTFCAKVFAELGLAADDAEVDESAAPARARHKHLLPQHYKRYKLRRFRFCFVRHPLTWYESWFRYQVGRWTTDWRERHGWHPLGEIQDCAADDFHTFLRNCRAASPGFVSRMYEWFIGPEGAEQVDFVGRQERLIADLAEVLTTRLGLIGPGAVMEQHKVNVSPGPTVVWSEELRQEFKRLEAPAIRRFYGRS